MPTLVPPHQAGVVLPDHTQLPETDGSIVQNFQEHPQAIVLDLPGEHLAGHGL